MPPDAPSRYIVTARKYRPQTFDDLVAQEHVTETLRNAIAHDRLAHAYLFSGPRGVGKTTAARLLAKAINCETPLEGRDRAEPCRTCPSCASFEEGRSLSILEVDAASNNKVEDVRELRETVRIPPQGARKKIYILDEVHMFSQGAFNALLKTLEEPPDHALFIFATTEPHKVLPTILSRCQRFDFRRITVPETSARLHEIAEAEGVDADEESLMLIARKGDGALRDALSTFDQAVSLCGTTLRAAPLAEALGVVDTDLFFATTGHAAAGDRAALLKLVDTIVRRGYDIEEFLGGLAEHVRDLLVVATTGTTDLVEAGETTRTRTAEAASAWTETDLLRLLMLVDAAEERLKATRQPRLVLELTLLKMAALERATDLRTLLGKLDRLEAAVADGTLPAPATPRAAPRPTTPSEPAPRPTATAETPAGYQPAAPSVPEATPAPNPSPAEAKTGPAPSEAPTPSEPPAPSEPAAEPATPAPPPAAGPSSPPPSRPSPPPEPAPAPPAADPLVQSGVFSKPALAPRPRRAPEGPSGDGSSGSEAVLAAVASDDPLGPTLGRVRSAWPELVVEARGTLGVRVSTILSDAEPTEVSRAGIEIAVPSAFAQSVLQSEADTLHARLRDVAGGALPPLRFVVRAPDTAETAASADPYETLKQLRAEHPVVRALFEKFGGDIDWDGGSL